MSKDQAGSKKVNEAFVALANGTIDAPSLMKFGEKAVREALEAMRAFKQVDEDRKKQEKEQEDAIQKLLVESGLISPVVNLKGVKGVREGTVNYAYAELIARPSGATWDELEAVRVRESKERGVELGGIKKFKGNFKSTLEKHGHTVTITRDGMKLTLCKTK